MIQVYSSVLAHILEGSISDPIITDKWMDCFNMFTGEGNKSYEDPDGRGNNGFRKQMSA